MKLRQDHTGLGWSLTPMTCLYEKKGHRREGSHVKMLAKIEGISYKHGTPNLALGTQNWKK